MRRRSRFVRVEDLLGRRVRTADGRVVGRIEEICAERVAGGEHEVREFHLGTGALLERLALVRQLLRRKSTVIIARWDQIDIGKDDGPVLTCAVEELRYEKR